MSLMVRNALHEGDPFYESKTERQWMELGFALKSEALGELMWSNAFCQHQAYYFRPDEVRPATEEEKAAWNTAEREKRRAAAQRRKERAEREAREAEERRKLEEELERQEIEREKRREVDGVAFYADTIAAGKKFIEVEIENKGYRWDGEEYWWNSYLTYVADAAVKVDDHVTVPYGYLNTPREGRVDCDGLTIEQLRLPCGDFPEWFPYGVKEIIAVV